MLAEVDWGKKATSLRMEVMWAKSRSSAEIALGLDGLMDKWQRYIEAMMHAGRDLRLRDELRRILEKRGFAVSGENRRLDDAELALLEKHCIKLDNGMKKAVQKLTQPEQFILTGDRIVDDSAERFAALTTELLKMRHEILQLKLGSLRPRLQAEGEKTQPLADNLSRGRRITNLKDSDALPVGWIGKITGIRDNIFSCAFGVAMEGVIRPFEIKRKLNREDIQIFSADGPSVNSVDLSYFKGKSVVLKSNAVLAIVCPDRIAAEGLDAEVLAA